MWGNNMPVAWGYGIINFTSHTLFQGGVLSDALDWYLRKSASAMLTIEHGKLTDGNPRGVYSPPQDDSAVALFENEVDLGPAWRHQGRSRSSPNAAAPIPDSAAATSDLCVFIQSW